MTIITGNLLVDLVGIATALFAVFYAYSQWIYQYWERKNIPFIPPSFPFGNVGNIFKRPINLGTISKNCYDEFYKKNIKFGGMFILLRPILIVTDLDIIKNILIKDFDHFTDRAVFYNEKGDPLTAHLFSLDGLKWRHLRNKLTPTFTSGKMKMMFETLAVCAPNMYQQIDQHMNKPLDIKEVVSRFTIDVIGSCAFGVDCNSFKDDQTPFLVYGQKLFTQDKFITFKQAFAGSFPKLALALNLRTIPKDVSTFFINMLKETIDYREKNNVKRNDFLQLLIEMKNEMSFNEMAAQCFVFFLAGFETSATTMTFALYSLASYPKIQERLRTEINTVLKKHENKLTYDAVFEMKYLRQVIDETLRLYPAVPTIVRNCIKDYVLEDGKVLEKGIQVTISNYGIQRNEDIFPNPMVFDPERFNDENRQKIHTAAYLPFGDGPRNCIGLRFGLMQTMVGLITLLRKYKFTVHPKTKEPLELDQKSFVLSVKGDLLLSAEKLED